MSQESPSSAIRRTVLITGRLLALKTRRTCLGTFERDREFDTGIGGGSGEDLRARS